MQTPASFFLLLLLSLAAVYTVLLKTGHLQENFQGKSIINSFGMFIVIWSSVTIWMTDGSSHIQSDHWKSWITLIIGFSMLGLIDDVWGDSRYKGLRGHIRALFLNGKVTTGLIKAMGGVVLSGWIAFHIVGTFTERIVGTLLIALSSNMLNLLDLRPGRANSIFLLIAACVIVVHNIWPLQIVFLAALVAWPLDSRAVVMLGDCGSNMLGAVLGLSLVIVSSFAFQVVTVIILIILHFVLEQISLTKIIDRSPILKRLDRMTGVR